MASAKQGFERFVAWLHQPEEGAASDVRRIANLVLANFDTIVPTKRHRSQRSALLATLAREQLTETPDTALVAKTTADNGAWPWERLKHLTLGPFRGFRTPELLTLDKRIVLIYGPNGSGKSSFCEALEYALLGAVEEAENKRIDSRVYLANFHEGRFESPSLKAVDHQNREVAVIANEEAYRFCFVEKNRIDAFSRIAARPAGQRSDLIATLFGMDQFSDFVSHFNESMDSQLVLEPEKERQLISRREALAQDQATVAGNEQALIELDQEEAELVGSHAEGMTYAELKQLVGSAEEPGRLQELEGILNSVPPAVIGLTRSDLRRSFEEVREQHDNVVRSEELLSERSTQVSFKELYTAVLALQDTEGDRCPACDTPISGPKHVVANPYEKAEAGLLHLKDLAELQACLAASRESLDTASQALWQQMLILKKFVAIKERSDAAVERYLAGLPAEPVDLWWKDIQRDESREPEPVSFEQLLTIADQAATQDAAATRAQRERRRHIEERDRLNQLQLKLQAQDLKRERHIEDVEAAKSRIAAFDERNAELIKQVDQEKLDIARDGPIKAAYDGFLSEIRRYREQLPAGLMAGLNETAMSLYNEFNRNDLDADKLEELYFPLTREDKIEIAFRGKPEARVDALRVLSEGHIRCLGLAVLLAKSKSIESPLIVFDDAINAIDHDHRGGIREAIFESDNFRNVQLIVTCHSNEFIKDIQQHLPRSQRAQSATILFRHHAGDYRPRITQQVPAGNYIARARAAKDLLDDRGALAASRQALEMVTAKTWDWMDSHGYGVLSLQLAGARKEPALRNVCDAIRKKLSKAETFGHPSKEPLLAAYGTILGIPENNLIWTYLNKGTHEEADRDDFDAEHVEELVQTLEVLDSIELRRGR